MKTFYSSSEYANYAHIHMYVFYECFIEQIRKASLDYEGSYSIDVDIDGNIAVWKISINDPQVEYIFNTLISDDSFIDKKRIKKAVKEIAEKMEKKFEIKNPELLLSEIKAIKLVAEKPSIPDNDDLDSPAIRFY